MGPGEGSSEPSPARRPFAEAQTVFGDPLQWTVKDPDHSIDEFRFLTTGISSQQRVIIVAHTERGDRIRIISAREVTAAERHVYEESE
ncbi:MAG TPA: BrnT family toxin [Thermoanaerobaculia bacterium]|nr:BrnT family toxin [Thermoanaerobaculia bacterium]